jgi:hypothetical protein
MYAVKEILNKEEKERFKVLLTLAVLLRAQVPVYIHTTYRRSPYSSTANTEAVQSSEMLAIFYQNL